MKVHLVDGTFELFRAYFGSPAAVGADGLEVGAVQGFMRSMLSLAGESAVTHVGIAFDRTVESFRNELFEGYKTGENIEPDLLAQFPLAEEAAAALGFVVWPMEHYEADDAIATAARRVAADPAVEQVVICSPDKDLAQCVRGRQVVSLDRIRRRVLDERGVEEKFGVSPASIPDWLGLVGDAADGIPGVPRWGAKSSAALLSHYGHIESIPATHEDWAVQVRGAAGLSASLEQHRDSALLYRRLATLCSEVPLTESTADLQWRGPDIGRLEPLSMQLKDEHILRRAQRVAEKS